MNTEVIFVWMMAFIRSSGLLLLLPVFSGRNVPMPMRIGLAGILAWAVTGSLRETPALPDDVSSLVLGAGHELLTGLLMGLAVRLVFFAVEMAGQIIATEIGLVMSSQLDPVSQNNSSPVGLALYQFASLVFLLSGAHHAVFAAFLRGFALSPPGSLTFHRGVGEILVQSTGNIFLVAVQMAAPIMAVNFIVTLTFAILGKAAPSINVFAESSAARILLGMTVLSLTIGVSAQLVLSQLRQSPELMLRLIP